MNMKRLLGAVVAAVICGAASAQAAPVLYIHDNSGMLGTVDISDGSVNVIGDMGAVMTDIAFDPDGNLYGLSLDAFYSIDKNTGAATLIGTHGIAQGNALVFGADGTLYGAGNWTTELFTIDIATGAGTSIGDIGTRSAGDLAFNDGEMYLSSTRNELVLIDLTGGSATGSVVGAFGFSQVFGLATAEDGTLYGLSGTDIFSVDTATGAGTLVVSYSGGVGVSYGSSFFTEAGAEPESVPEPGTLALVGGGLAALGLLRRRREVA